MDKFKIFAKAIRKKGAEPFESFERKEKLSASDKRALENPVLKEIDALFAYEPTKKSAVRFSKVFLANVLRAYRADEDDPSGIELSIRKNSTQSVHTLGMRKISDDVVETVVRFLVKNRFVKKLKAKKYAVTKKDASGTLKIVWHQDRSTAWVAEQKLIDLCSGKIDVKICRTCRKEKPISQFGKQRNGFEAECTSCRSQRRSAARLAGRT